EVEEEGLRELVAVAAADLPPEEPRAGGRVDEIVRLGAGQLGLGVRAGHALLAREPRPERGSPRERRGLAVPAPRAGALIAPGGRLGRPVGGRGRPLGEGGKGESEEGGREEGFHVLSVGAPPAPVKPSRNRSRAVTARGAPRVYTEPTGGTMKL